MIVKKGFSNRSLGPRLYPRVATGVTRVTAIYSIRATSAHLESLVAESGAQQKGSTGVALLYAGDKDHI